MGRTIFTRKPISTMNGNQKKETVLEGLESLWCHLGRLCRNDHLARNCGNRPLVFWTIIIVMAGIIPARSDEVVLPYSSFGPQVLAYKLIGKEWWQWLPEGGSKAEEKNFEIKVVVYWDEDRSEIEKKYPVIPKKNQDYRYVELSAAIAHLSKIVKDYQGDDSADLAAIKNTLRKLRDLSRSRGGIGDSQKELISPTNLPTGDPPTLPRGGEGGRQKELTSPTDQ